jgi:ribosomal protein S18 acetylase RimI-like enzyme
MRKPGSRGSREHGSTGVSKLEPEPRNQKPETRNLRLGTRNLEQETSITITAATPGDTADVIRLFGALHQFNAELDPRFALADGWEALVEEYLQESKDSDESAWLLARHADRAIGFVLVEVHTDAPLYRHRRWAEIVGLYVEPEFRGGAIAERLMQHAYAWAIDHHLRIMQLFVTAENHRAQRFYEKQGFRASQTIMRRALFDAELEHDAPAQPATQRLHFSEGGERPLDMHEQRRRQQ